MTPTLFDVTDALERELSELRRENQKLREQVRRVRAANASAAQKLVRMSLDRERELEAQKNEAQAALAVAEQASVEKTLFLANVSHELRTPLNGILGLATILLDDETDEWKLENLGMLRQSGEVLLQIVNDILDFSKIEVGRLELDRTRFDIWRMAEGLIGVFHASNKKPELRVRLEIDPDLPREVLGDELRFRQVLTNLLGNAVKFTDAGVVALQLTRAGDKLDVEVSDTGCGIAEGQIATLFEPFTQADDSATRRVGGTGLGLAICRRLVRLMGGEVHVASEVHRGSRFWFRIPLLLPEEPAPAVRADFRIAELRIGDPLTAMTIREHLHALDVEVQEKSPIAEGVDQPRLLFFDADGELQPSDARALVRAGDRVILVCGNEVDRVASWREAIPEVRVLHRPLLPTALLAQCAATTERQAERTERRAFAGLHVLLVEDNAINARVANVFLRTMGCEVDHVCDGLQALEAATRTPYDIILMDLQMPVMDGYESTVRIRAAEQDSGHRSRIVALTAHALSEDRERCLSIGMDDYVAKPVSRPALAAAIDPARAAAMQLAEPSQREA